MVAEKHCVALEWPDDPMVSSAGHFLYEILGRVSTCSADPLV